MNNVVLFCPLGKTDPTRGNYDGALLHILRHYKPSKAYLFMTGEISEYDSKDNRYEIMAKRLLNECEIIKLRHSNMTNPADFAPFNEIFKNELNMIREQNPGCKIIVNLSSGTAQMKSALYFLCGLSSWPMTAVQVMSPSGKGNDSKAVGLEYDIEYEWNNLIDNDQEMEPENRCVEVKVDNAWGIVAKEIISSHIKHYEYSAALTVATMVKGFLSERVLLLLEAGASRLVLDYPKAADRCQKADYDLFPVKAGNAREVFEYILSLHIKIKKKELGDFARSVSPAITKLFQRYLEEQCKVNIEKYLYQGFKLKGDKLPPDVRVYYNEHFALFGGYRDSPLSASSMLPYIEYEKGLEDKGTVLAQQLRKFEESIRNKAAHDILHVSNEWIQKEITLSADDMIKLLKRFFELTFPPHAKKQNWDSYELLNQEIIRELGID